MYIFIDGVIYKGDTSTHVEGTDPSGGWSERAKVRRDIYTAIETWTCMLVLGLTLTHSRACLLQCGSSECFQSHS